MHDNFRTTPSYVKFVPNIYTGVFIEMDHPLQLIDEFIQLNIGDHMRMYFDEHIQNYPSLFDIFKSRETKNEKDMDKKS